MYVCIDTHTLIWYLTNDTRLSSRVESFLFRAEAGELTIVVPIIVLLECMDIFEKEKVHFDFQTLVLRVTNAQNFIVSALDWTVVLETERTKGFKDLHDRIIVATAKLFDATLLSKDRIIRSMYAKATW